MKAVLPIAALLSLAACESRDPVAKGAENGASLPAPAESNASDPTGAPPPDCCTVWATSCPARSA